MNNQTTETLKRIMAKKTLGIPLTPHETAFLILYSKTDTEAAEQCK